MAQGAAIACLAVAGPAGATAPYREHPPALSTPWTQKVSTLNPWPEYPRPQLQRSRWMSLNGRWQYQAGQAGGPPPIGQSLAQTILVPFPVQSPLSGIGQADQRGWYRRLFRIPGGWRPDHVMLDFGAVSWQARVYVNGRLAGTHRGDYDAFSLDITRYLKPTGENELVVGFYDPVGAAGEPIGKQITGTPYGYFHTASSGIWQTVWLEPVSAEHIAGLQLTPELRSSRLIVTPAMTGGSGGTLVADALAAGRTVASAKARPGRQLVLRIPHPHEWSPWDPYLYGLRLELVGHGRVLDSAHSYFGMRSVSLGRAGGVTRILLNGRFVFETGALDQGMWPDGLYTPPADAAIRADILAAKRMGYDMLREHEKVQPDRWYYWADRLGILVWQDMPSRPAVVPAARQHASQAEFERELARIVVQHRSDPAVIVWVPFNEGWGQFDPAGVTAEVRRLAPGELIDTDSGSADCCGVREPAQSDVRDAHLYSGPFAVAPDRRASVVGEYGGVLPYPPASHRWPGVLTSIGSPVLAWGHLPVTKLLEAQYSELAQEMRMPGLSAAVFTELSGAEQELGILTYDRRAYTISPSIIRRLNDSLVAASQQAAGLRSQPPAIPAGASGAWSFGERRGTTAADSSPAHRALTLSAGAGWASGPLRRGRSTGALAITAPGQVAESTVAVIGTSGSFTVSAWLRPAVVNQSGTAVSEPGPDGSAFSLGLQAEATRYGNPATRWTFLVPAHSRCTAAQCGARANTRYDDGRYSVRAGRWYAVTGIYDSRSQTIALYVDGIPQDIEHVFGVPPARGPLTVGEGIDDYPSQDAFLGDVTDLRTYARALAPGQVWQLYRAQVS